MADPAPPRRRFQFRLRTLMIGVTLLAVPCRLHRLAGENCEGGKKIRESVVGSFVTAPDFAKMVHGGIFKLETLPHISSLRRLLGDEAMVSISVFKDDDVDAVRVAFPEAEVNGLRPMNERLLATYLGLPTIKFPAAVLHTGITHYPIGRSVASCREIHYNRGQGHQGGWP